MMTKNIMSDAVIKMVFCKLAVKQSHAAASKLNIILQSSLSKYVLFKESANVSC